MTYKRILMVNEKVKRWPSRVPEHYKVEFLGKDNKTFEGYIHETEYELWKFFLGVKDRLKDSEIDQAERLIENFGQYKYNEGSFDASATEDL